MPGSSKVRIRDCRDKVLLGFLALLALEATFLGNQ